MQFALGAVTVLALLMTLGMGVVTWHLLREERRRSAARLAALATELERRGLAPPGVVEVDDGTARDDAPPFWHGRGAVVGLAGAVAVVSVGAVVLALSSAAQAPVDALGPGSDEAEAEVTLVPVELTELAYEQQAATLAISGIVRNPPHGQHHTELWVAAVAFDETGTTVGTGRVPVDTATLPAGADSSFAVTIPVDRASRYQISFQVDETTVPHVDRRPRPSDTQSEVTS